VVAAPSAIPINTQIATRHKALGERTGLGIGKENDPAFTLQEGHSHAVAAECDGWRSKTGSLEYAEDRAPCIQANMPPNVCAGFMAGQGAKAGSIAYSEELSPTLKSAESGGNQVPSVVYDAPSVFENHGQDSRISGPLEVAPTVSQKFGTGGNNIPLVYDARGNGDGKVANTLIGNHHQSGISDYTVLAVHQNQCGEVRTGEVANTLNTNGNASGRNAPLVAAIAYDINPVCIATGQANAEVLENLTPTLNCNHEQPIVGNRHVVRRLTPIECERLQGFPDGWTEYGIADPRLNAIRKYTPENYRDTPRGELLRKISDSARYKALGNSLAVPCVEYILSGIAERGDGE